MATTTIRTRTTTTKSDAQKANQEYAKTYFWLKSLKTNSKIRLQSLGVKVCTERGGVADERWQTRIVDAADSKSVFAIGNAIHTSMASAQAHGIRHCGPVTALWSDDDWAAHEDEVEEAAIAKATADAAAKRKAREEARASKTATAAA